MIFSKNKSGAVSLQVYVDFIICAVCFNLYNRASHHLFYFKGLLLGCTLGEDADIILRAPGKFSPIFIALNGFYGESDTATNAQTLAGGLLLHRRLGWYGW